MKKTSRFLPLILAAALLGGCSYPAVNKTIVLPSQETTDLPGSDEQDTGWEVKKIYQYQYISSNVSNKYIPSATTIGWSSEEDYILYTINKLWKDQQTIINKVDVRYGFYEECANLGDLQYNSMKISPDGKYLLYDVTDHEDGKAVLYLYSISDHTTNTVAEVPCPIPDLLTLNFSWSDDSSTFFYWMTSLTEGYSIAEFIKTEGWEDFYKICAPFFDSPDGNMLYQIKCGNPASLEQKTVLDLERELLENMGYDPGFVIGKKIIVSPDGQKILVSGEYDAFPFIITADCGTGQTQIVESSKLYDNTNANVIFTQLTGDKAYGRDYYDSSSMLFFTSLSNFPEYTQVTLRDPSSARENYSFQTLVTPDESHLITLELASTKETQVYIYQIQGDGSGRLTGKTLLYQSTDDIYDVMITPDSRFIILRTLISEGNSYGVNFSAAGSESVGDSDEIYASGADNRYKITVLEL